jgi:isopentenyl phosphate kinase
MKKQDSSKGLVFLKLGGSLITDKHSASTARPEVIRRAVEEIAQALEEDPTLQLVLGHGSGSFGHVAAKRYRTRRGVATPEEWRGFTEVWQAARALNHMVVEALHQAGLPAISFPASTAATVANGRVQMWDLSGLKKALTESLLPVVYGDVVFDTVQGGTILSTEDIFMYLADHLHPRQILLAGIEPGVWADYPARTQLVETITPDNRGPILLSLGGSAAIDVTGGMLSKVEEMLALAELIEGLEVIIFSGDADEAILDALKGEAEGTRISGK